MTRFPSLLRPMLPLALAAMLLAVAAPAVSRVLSAAGWQAAPGLVEMCTASGRLLASDMGLGGPRDPAPAPQPSMDEACGYCTLPPPVPLATAAAIAPPGWHASSAMPAHAAPPTRTWRNPHGLGARAPPVSP